MSPPRCHSGSGDNGTPAFGNTTPPRCTDIIFLSRRGAETEPLLARRASGCCPAVIFGQWLRCDLPFGHILFSAQLFFFFLSTSLLRVYCAAASSRCPATAVLLYITQPLEPLRSNLWPLRLCQVKPACQKPCALYPKPYFSTKRD